MNNDQVIQAWLDQVDTIDPFYGDMDRLRELLASAPTRELKKWLEECIQQNEVFRNQLFGGNDATSI